MPMANINRPTSLTLECNGSAYRMSPMSATTMAMSAIIRGKVKLKMTSDEDRMRELLRIHLSCQVPLYMMEIRAYRRGWDWIMSTAQDCAQVVAEKGDIIQFKSKGTAAAVSKLALGLACASFVPGGVRFLGDHYEECPDWLEAASHEIIERIKHTIAPPLTRLG